MAQVLVMAVLTAGTALGQVDGYVPVEVKSVPGRDIVAGVPAMPVEGASNSHGVVAQTVRTRNRIGAMHPVTGEEITVDLRVSVTVAMLGPLVFGAATSTVPDDEAGSLPMGALVFSHVPRSGTMPIAGNRTWRGTALATDSSLQPGDTGLLIGDLEIASSDSDGGSLTVSLTNIVDLDQMERRKDLVWTGVVLDGADFHHSDEGIRLEGSFHGDDHQGAIGSFTAGDLEGTFGALPEGEQAPAPPTAAAPDPDSPFDFLVGRLAGPGAGAFVSQGPGATDALGSGPLPEDPVEPPTDTEISAIFPSRIEVTISTQGTVLGDGELVTERGVQRVQTEMASPGQTGPGLRISFTSRFSRGLLGDGGWYGTVAGLTEVSVDLENLLDGVPEPEAGASGADVGFFFPPTVWTETDAAAGRLSLSNPVSGSAEWTGVVVGKDLEASSSLARLVRGDARLTINDFAVHELDVEFTGLVDLTSGRERSDMLWSRVPVSRGIFRRTEEDSSLQGFFLGPDHGEATGIFERDGISGAFGVSRQLHQSATDPGPRPSFQSIVSLRVDGLQGGPFVGVHRNPRDLADDLGAASRPLAPYNGIALWQTSVESAEADSTRGPESLSAWGGWLQHGSFMVSWPGDENPEGSAPPSAVLATTLGRSIYLNPPEGGARWSGVMLGVDVSESHLRGNRVRGKATLTVQDLGRLRVNVVFTDVVDLVTGRWRSDFRWYGISVFEGGFETSVDDHQLSGQFYGPDSEEVAGVFRWHDVVGSYGATAVEP